MERASPSMRSLVQRHFRNAAVLKASQFQQWAHGRRVAGDVMKSAQVIAPRNLAFGPNAALRAITGDRLALKEDAAQYIRSNYQISDVKRVAGALAVDRNGWTVSTRAAVVPILMPKPTRVVRCSLCPVGGGKRVWTW